jgi:hypothetical protein
VHYYGPFFICLLQVTDMSIKVLQNLFLGSHTATTRRRVTHSLHKVPQNVVALQADRAVDEQIEIEVEMRYERGVTCQGVWGSAGPPPGPPP